MTESTSSPTSSPSVAESQSENIAADSTTKSRANTDARPAKSWERETMERLLFESLRESRRQRRWKIFFRLSFLFLALAAIVVGVDWKSSSHAVSGPHIALLKLNGGVGAGERINAPEVISALQKAFADTTATSVLLSINSPGGSPVHANLIHQEIIRLRALYPHKPVYAVTDDICASAAYYIAVASDKIFVNPASLVGSIGVISSNFGFDRVMQKWGVERRVTIAGVNKDMGDPFAPQTAKQKQHLQAMLNEIHLQFIGAVKRGRGARLKESADTFSGLAWVGKQAVEMGLADGFGSVDSIVRELGKGQVVDYTVNEDLQERLFKKIGMSMSRVIGQTIEETLGATTGRWAAPLR